MTNCLKCGQPIGSVCPSFDKDTDLKYVVKFLSNKFLIDVCSENFIEEKDGYYILNILADKELYGTTQCTKINQIIEGIVVKGWEVILQSNPDCDFYDEFIAERNFDVEHFHSTLSIHRGHLLARKFKEYLVSDENCKKRKNNVNAFFGKGCVENISYQTKKSNCDSKHHHGQLFFERKILAVLEKNEESKVYYNIYDISVNERSLGRVINYYNDCSSSSEMLEWIFIPNV